MCNGHDEGKGKIPQIRQGETVWAKHRNTRYYQAKVESIQDILFYMVTFDDNSFSDDLFPSDITVSFCTVYFLFYSSLFEAN